MRIAAAGNQSSWDGRTSESSPVLLEQGCDTSLGIRGRLLAAPGTCILSTIRAGQLGVYSGTSQACPHVSGVIALAYGTDGEDGPCTHIPPLRCMQLVVGRATALEQQARMGFGFFPFTIADEAEAAQTGHSGSADEVEVRIEDAGFSGSGSRFDSDPMSAENDAEAAARAKAQAAAKGAMVRVRKFYGPPVTALLA